MIESFKKSGTIKSAGDIERYVHHVSRETRKPVYWYRCKCELNE